MCDSIDNQNPGEKYTNEQKRVLELFSKGYSLFLTGKGGCGKSFVLKGIIENVRKNLGPSAIAVTAPTGKSALNVDIGAQTIHSWAGVGLGKETRYQLCDKVLANEECLARWNKCQIIVIDEVSQLELNLFEKIEFIARRVKKTDSPFGGLQLILSGDFYQLPPVSEGEKLEYCFQSLMWSKCIDFSIKLTQVIRQSESEFLVLLNEIRQGGCLSQFAIDMLNSLTRPIEWKKGETALKLFPHKEEVQEENNKLLNLLPGETHVFNAIDGGKSKKRIDSRCPAPNTLLLKVGAPVMLIKNYHHSGLVNGSLGTVIGFVRNYPQVRFENGQTIIVREYTWSVNDGCYSTRRQLPLVLAWGMTIHKCQGQTLSKAEISMSNLFAPGQAYVALSRVKTLEGLRVLPGFDKNIPTISKHVHQFYQEKVLPVSDVKCENIIPIRMVISNHHDDTCKLMDNGKPVSNDWRHILPLPATLKAGKILKDMVTDEMNSQKTKQLMLDIGFDKETVPSMLLKFICHSWMKLEKMVAKPEVNEVVVVSKKNWVGYAGGIHKLKISTDLSNRWIEVLNSSEVCVRHGRILSYEQRSVMAQLVDKLHAALIGKLLTIKTSRYFTIKTKEKPGIHPITFLNTALLLLLLHMYVI